MNKTAIPGSVFLILVFSVHAAPIVDQAYLIQSGGGNSLDPRAQTFTVGIEGTLSGAAFNVVNNSGRQDAPYRFEIRTTEPSGVPSYDDQTGLLASFEGTSADLPSLNAQNTLFDVSQFNILIDVGDVLAAVFWSYESEILMNADYDGSDYAGGKAYIKQGGLWTEHAPFGSESDFMFVTYVTPIPEPASGALILVTIGILGLRNARTRRDKNRSYTRQRNHL
jgi:hypothetical protein